MFPSSHTRLNENKNVRTTTSADDIPPLQKKTRINKNEEAVNLQQDKLFKGQSAISKKRKTKTITKGLGKSQKMVGITPTDTKYHPKIVAACKKHHIDLQAYKEFMHDFTDNFNHMPAIPIAAIQKAMKNNDFNMLRVLKALGADLNQFDSSGYFPITRAVIDNNVDLVRLLVDLEASPNQLDRFGVPLIIKAIIECKDDEGDNNIVRLLIDLGANLDNLRDLGFAITVAVIKQKANILSILAQSGVNLNLPNRLGMTPMITAVMHNLPHIVSLLATFKVDVNQPCITGETPMAMAMLTNNFEMIILLEDLKANKEEAEEIIRRKFLAEIWGLQGTSVLKSNVRDITIQLEGFTPSFILGMLSIYVNSFFNSNESINSLIPKNKQYQILEVLKNAFPLSSKSNSENISAINSGMPFVILGGSHDHAIPIVINNKKLIVFNRAVPSGSESVKIYILPSSLITENLLEDLKKQYPDVNSFNQMIASLNLKSLRGIALKQQRVGNCPWIGAKGVFLILLMLYGNKTIAKEVIKKFNSFSREKSLRDYFGKSVNYGFDLIEQINIKLKKKSGLRASKRLIKEHLTAKPL